MIALQWLAPSLARDGLLGPEQWVLPAWAQAATLFADPDLHLPAQFLAVLHRHALDYIRQAPVLVIAATNGKQLLRRDDRLQVARRFIAECEGNLRLGQLMRSYGLAPQLRTLSGHAVRSGQRDILTALATIPASRLVQSIPREVSEQSDWLQCLDCWRCHMGRHCHSRELFLDWAAANLRDAQAREAAIDIADFACRNRATFKTKWSFAQARAAAQRWHGELAREPRDAASASRAWLRRIDYAPLPTQIEIEGYAFHALQTRQDIFDEGARMRHCLRIYADKVAGGSSRIYAMRLAGKPVATLELVRTNDAPAPPKFALSQLKGPHNSSPSPGAVRAAAAFVAGYAEGIPADVPAAEPLRLKRVRTRDTQNGSRPAGHNGQ